MRSLTRGDTTTVIGRAMGVDERWVLPPPIEVPRALRVAVGGHPLVAETLVRLGIDSVEAALGFLDPDAYEPASPYTLPDMEAAIARVVRAIEVGEKICVWGDFDVDGQTATTVLITVLQDLGAEPAHHIPLRATESHGIRLPQLEKELDAGARLIITCDTGVDAQEAVAYARARGVDFVITDHHELPATLPEAVAVVNPHRLPDDHPLATLPGVGVAYKMAEALYEAVGRTGDASALVDLVALGIVADVAVVRGDTRYLLQQGLRVLRQTPRIGLRELVALSRVGLDAMDAETIGFTIAPRLNALGRLGDANSAVEFLTTQDLTRARILASQLEALNNERKLLCDQVYAAAQARLERDPAHLAEPVLVLDDPNWPPGVIGIVANRLAEQYRRPVVLIATPPGGLGRGSARSISGLHITELLSTQAELLEGFGGHAMAAGLTIAPDRIGRLRTGLSAAVASQLEGRPLEPKLSISGAVTLSEIALPFARDLGRLAPFGPGNPEPTLMVRGVGISGQRQLGRTGHHLRVTVEDRDRVARDVVWWNWRGAPLPEGEFDLAFTVRLNDYRGEVEAQLVWKDSRSSRPSRVGAARGVAEEIAVVDQRGISDAETALRSWREVWDGLEVWAEGPDAEAVTGKHRMALAPAGTLVIWDCPPGPEALQLALKQVAPSRVVLVGREAQFDSPKEFLMRLSGMVKHALRVNEGRISVPDLAAHLGHREISVRKGLEWLAAKGSVTWSAGNGAIAGTLVQGGSADPERLRVAGIELKETLGETAAYRNFFMRADKDRLLAEAP